MPSVEELACLNCTLAICDERDRGCYFYKPPVVKVKTDRQRRAALYYQVKQKDKRAVARIEAKLARRAIIEQLRLELYA